MPMRYLDEVGLRLGLYPIGLLRRLRALVLLRRKLLRQIRADRGLAPR